LSPPSLRRGLGYRHATPCLTYPITLHDQPRRDDRLSADDWVVTGVVSVGDVLGEERPDVICGVGQPRRDVAVEPGTARQHGSAATLIRMRSPKLMTSNTTTSSARPFPERNSSSSWRSTFEARMPVVIRKVSGPIALGDTGASGGRRRGNSAQSRARADLAFDLLWAGYGLWAG
jgi:hypothetical protein